MDDILNPKSRGLGRGLSALFEDDEGVYPQADLDGHTPGRVRQVLGLDQLMPFRGQPRRTFHETGLLELADSLQRHGVLQPLIVRENPDQPGRYEIIAGERRWRAAQRAQLHEVPVIILTITDSQAFEIALVENLQREDLDPMEEAAGFQKLLHEYEYTQEQLADSLGKSRSYIANMIRLINLPLMVQSYLSEGRISIGHARALIPSPHAEALAKEIMAKGLSVRQTEALVAESQGRLPKARGVGSAEGRSSAQKVKDVNTLALEEEVSSTLGMKVSIDSADGKAGTLQISFTSLDQLDELLHRLSHFPGSRLNG